MLIHIRGLLNCLPALSCPSVLSILCLRKSSFSYKTMPKSKIPDRWEGYSKMGKVIQGTSIMPIKVPLRESLTSSLPLEERFPPSALLGLFQEKELKLCGVVDLTYTTRYYDSQFFPENGVGYKKVFTAGHVIPNNKTFEQFASAIKSLEKEGAVICVHCTHGLNRSGYMICRYMIEVLSIEPQSAIHWFEQARGHKIERQNYIDDLMNRTPGAKADFQCVPDSPSNDRLRDNSTSSHQENRSDSSYPRNYRPRDRRERTYRNRQDSRHQNGFNDSGIVPDERRLQKGPVSHIGWDETRVPPHRDHQGDDSRWNSRFDRGHHRDYNTEWQGRGYRNHEDEYHPWNGGDYGRRFDRDHHRDNNTERQGRGYRNHEDEYHPRNGGDSGRRNYYHRNRHENNSVDDRGSYGGGINQVSFQNDLRRSGYSGGRERQGYNNHYRCSSSGGGEDKDMVPSSNCHGNISK